MKWVTWEQVGIDRMGCAWLIRRSIDTEAEFLFVPMGHQSLPKGAEPFDIPGVRLSHHGGHCSFTTVLQVYGLADPILQRIARMIDEADTVQEVTLEPVAPGLDLLCRGLRRISPDDQTALERGALLYEALYAQLASDMASTTTGTHGPRDGEPRADGGPHMGSSWEADHETPDEDALARWEGEGGTPAPDAPTGCADRNAHQQLGLRTEIPPT
jgi:hypothetical protein